MPVSNEDRLALMQATLDAGRALSRGESQWLMSVAIATRKDRDYWLDAHEGLAHHYASLRARVEAVSGGLRLLAASANPTAMGTLRGAYTAIARDIDCAVAGRDIEYEAKNN